jgi:RNA polymerase sigma factor FliA
MTRAHPADQWLPLCARIARRTGRTASAEDREDLTSELHITLLSALEDYDAAREIPLSRYLRKRLRFRALEWFRCHAPRAIGKNGRLELEHPELCTPLRHEYLRARFAIVYPRSLEEAIEVGGDDPVTLAETLPDPRPTPEERCVEAEEAEELWGRVAALPVQWAQIMALHYGEGLTWKEASELLGITPRSGYRRSEWARAELRRERGR